MTELVDAMKGETTNVSECVEEWRCAWARVEKWWGACARATEWGVAWAHAVEWVRVLVHEAQWKASLALMRAFLAPGE